MPDRHLCWESHHHNGDQQAPKLWPQGAQLSSWQRWVHTPEFCRDSFMLGVERIQNPFKVQLNIGWENVLSDAAGHMSPQQMPSEEDLHSLKQTHPLTTKLGASGADVPQALNADQQGRRARGTARTIGWHWKNLTKLSFYPFKASLMCFRKKTKTAMTAIIFLIARWPPSHPPKKKFKDDFGNFIGHGIMEEKKAC